MRILLTVHQFVPDYAAGTEVLTLHTAQELQARGHEVTVFTAYPSAQEIDDEDRFDEYEVEGIPVARFRHNPVPMGGQTNTQEAEYNNLFVGKYLRRNLLQKVRPDVVHFFHLARISASAVDACRAFGIRMVLTPTDFWFVCPTSQLRLPDNSMCPGPDRNSVNCLRHLVALNQSEGTRSKIEAMPDWALGLAIQAINRGLVQRWFAEPVRALSHRVDFLRERMNALDRVLVPTRLMETTLKENGLRAEKVVFSPYGIKLASLSRASRTVSPNLRVGFIGTIYEHKGPHLLVQAMRMLPERAIELKIYGRTDEFPKYTEGLRQMAAGDTRIQFCGTFPNAKIDEIFSELDVLVVPSIWHENTPLVIYSAQAAKCPVIASNLGGMSEVIEHEVNGLLFTPGDVAGLAKAIERLLLNRDLAKQLSDRSRPPRSIAEYVTQLEGIYQELTAKPLKSELLSHA
jgi:glycosyltransferase involved in cell wall biosynthesis